MYNVSQNFLNIIKQNGRQFKSSATVRDTAFDDSSIVEIDLEENVNPTDSFMLGGVGSSQLTVTLANVPDSLILENAKVSGNLGLLVNGAYENIPLGKFTVDDIDKGTDSNNTVKLTCYDNMILLEQAYFSDLSYPADIQDVANEICSKAGVTLASTLPQIQINKIDGYTYREAVGFIASFLGGFARFNRDGNLEITSYVDSGLSIDKNDYTSSFTRNENNFTVGKLTCKVGDNIISVGSNGNEIQFENPIMTQDQLNSIYNTLKNLSYMPFSTDWRGNQAVQAGDKITITDLKGNAFSTLVMDNKFTYKGGLSGNISATGKTQTGQNFSSSGSTNNAVDRLVTEQANIKVLLADTATIEDLTATNANIQTLFADNASISNLIATKANIADLNATNANVQNLQANKANISDLTASNARISTLEADASSINTLLAGNIGASNIKAGAIQSGSAIIANGAIGSAQISSLDVGKLNAGTLDTTKITIAGANSRLLLKGNRLQVFATKTDNSLYERVSIGDVNGDGSDYGLRVRGADGTTILLDETGVKREGITDGSINNAKIGSDANISGTKLDINSVVTAINGGTTTIQSSKIFLNNSTLDVQFGTLSTTVTSQGQSISNQSTQISANTTAISAKLDAQTFSNYQTTVNGQISSINTQLSTQSSSITALQGQIVLKVSQTDINNTLHSNNLALTFNNLVGCTANGNNVTSTASNWGSSGCSSTQSISNGQYIECTITSAINTGGVMFGLSNTDTNQNYTSIQYAWYIDLTSHANGLGIWENGTNIGVYGTWAIGDVLRIAVENNKVNYYQNGVLKYISSQIPSLPLVLDTAFYLSGNAISNINIGTMLSGVATRINTAESSITQLSNSITSKVDVNGVISTIQQNPSSVQIAFNKINSAMCTFDSTGFHVKNGIIDSSTFYSKYDSGNVSMKIGSYGINFYDDGSTNSFGTGLNYGANTGGLFASGGYVSLSTPVVGGTLRIGSDNFLNTYNGHYGSSMYFNQDSNGVGTVKIYGDTIGLYSATSVDVIADALGTARLNVVTIRCGNGSNNDIYFDCDKVTKVSNGNYSLPWANGISEFDFEWQPMSTSYVQISTTYGAWGINVWASDISLKENIRDSSEDALSTINNIKHRMFNWKNGGYLQRLGYVAQELNEVNPDFVMKVPQSDGYIRMQPDETRIIPYMTKAIQEEDSKVEELKNRITTLENIVSEQQAQIKDLKAS